MVARGLRQHVIEEIGTRVISGVYQVGVPIPSEAELCRKFEVSRTALREALRELAAKGLLIAKQRVGTVVRSREEWNFLDADILAWRNRALGSLQVIQELYELRQLIEPAAAALAALNATKADIAVITQALQKMTEADGDGELLIEPDLQFHKAVLTASGNSLFSALSHAISAALTVNFDLLKEPPRGHRHFHRRHEAVLEAISARKPAAARLAMQTLIEDSRQDAVSVGSKANGSLRSRTASASGNKKRAK
jgi:DNA-binding FadR family transcriptional regulator